MDCKGGDDYGNRTREIIKHQDNAKHQSIVNACERCLLNTSFISDMIIGKEAISR